MLEIINFFSTVDDLLIVAGVLMIAWGQGTFGLVLILSGVAIMFGKGEIGVPLG
ncbi:MAG: hypothetical protein ABH863_04530 [Candidatus Micrarchaeota archaeon]